MLICELRKIFNAYQIRIKTGNGVIILKSKLYDGKRAKQSAMKLMSKLKTYLKYTEFKDLTKEP